jgi:carboxylesterase type B
MLAHRKSGIAESFCKSILRSLTHLPPGAAKKLLRAYNIHPALDDTLALRSILNFATDIGYLAPAVSLAQGWPGTAYLYHFNEPNPWDGGWKGDATHVLDVAFLFQNYNEFLPPPQREAAVRFAGDVIRFANGEAPWPAFEAGRQGAMVYGPSQEACRASFVPYTEGIAGQRCGRRTTIFELMEEFSLDELAACWGDFLAGGT